jgi:hypothetical protein
MPKQKPKFTITVTRIGTPDVIEKVELYESTALEAEKRLSETWNKGYCMQPGRFRARLRDENSILMTID